MDDVVEEFLFKQVINKSEFVPITLIVTGFSSCYPTTTSLKYIIKFTVERATSP